ncbi:hypothetical protein EVAR_37715_1 [Eumeta japonica]|uniref:Uncharacterized protein n=1 Tax=Eumeta variegata TaxID=151549 RepID=A0A4C1YJP5_EUMVA|nr:hypothetical protein EVAR_37715_1 [Eumeta japonica]
MGTTAYFTFSGGGLLAERVRGEHCRWFFYNLSIPFLIWGDGRFDGSPRFAVHKLDRPQVCRSVQVRLARRKFFFTVTERRC